MSTPRVSHVILRVASMARALPFWRYQVGLPVRAAGGAFAFLDAGPVAIALNEAPPEPGGGGLAALTEVVLEVDDVRSAHGEMAARGVPFRVPPRPVTNDGRRALWAADFRDPDGHLVSLTGWVEG